MCTRFEVKKRPHSASFQLLIIGNVLTSLRNIPSPTVAHQNFYIKCVTRDTQWRENGIETRTIGHGV